MVSMVFLQSEEKKTQNKVCLHNCLIEQIEYFTFVRYSCYSCKTDFDRQHL